MTLPNLSRRGFLGGVLTVIAASQLPKQLLAQPIPTLWSDGIHDDWEALVAFFREHPFHTADGFNGTVHEGLIQHGNFMISKPLPKIINSKKLVICYSKIRLGAAGEPWFIDQAVYREGTARHV